MRSVKASPPPPEAPSEVPLEMPPEAAPPPVTGKRLHAVRGVLAWPTGFAVLIVSVALAITIGPADIGMTDVWSAVAAHLGLGEPELTPIRDGIVWNLRLPRTLLAAVCGAGLAVCGAVMQSLLRNPLADPFVLGVSSGASTGAVWSSYSASAAAPCRSRVAPSSARSSPSRWYWCSARLSAAPPTVWCCPGWPPCSCSPRSPPSSY